MRTLGAVATEIQCICNSGLRKGPVIPARLANNQWSFDEAAYVGIVIRPFAFADGVCAFQGSGDFRCVSRNLGSN